MNEVQWFLVFVAGLVVFITGWTIGWWRGFRSGEMSTSDSIREAERRLDRRMDEAKRPMRTMGEWKVIEESNERAYQRIMADKGWLNEEGEPEEGWMYEVIHNGFGHTIDIVRSPEPDLGEI